MATNFSPSSGSYVLNKFPSISQWSDTGPSWPSCLPYPNKPWCFHVCKKSSENTVRKGQIACYKQCFSPLGELYAIFTKFEVVVCKLLVWNSPKFVFWERVKGPVYLMIPSVVIHGGLLFE